MLSALWNRLVGRSTITVIPSVVQQIPSVAQQMAMLTATTDTIAHAINNDDWAQAFELLSKLAMDPLTLNPDDDAQDLRIAEALFRPLIAEFRIVALINLFDNMDSQPVEFREDYAWAQGILRHVPAVLTWAIESDEWKIVRCILAHGAVVLSAHVSTAVASGNQRIINLILAEGPLAAEQAVMTAIKNRHPLPAVQTLLDAKITIPHQALTTSIWYSNTDVIRALLHRKATVDYAAIEGALVGRSSRTLQLLVDASAQSAAQDTSLDARGWGRHMRIIERALLSGPYSFGNVQVLLNTKIDIGRVSAPLLSQTVQCLHRSDPQQGVPILHLLLAAKADPRVGNVIEAAVFGDNPRAMDTLLSAKAPLTTSTCRSALVTAATNGSIRAAKWLIAHCGNHLRSADYNAAISTAVRNAGREDRKPPIAGFFPAPSAANANTRMDHLAAGLRHADLHQLGKYLRGMQPFQRRPHLNNKGADVRDDVWTAVAHRDNHNRMNVVGRLVRLGVDVTRNAIQAEVDRIHRESDSVSNYFKALVDASFNIRESDIDWPPPQVDHWFPGTRDAVALMRTYMSLYNRALGMGA